MNLQEFFKGDLETKVLNIIRNKNLNDFNSLDLWRNICKNDYYYYYISQITSTLNALVKKGILSTYYISEKRSDGWISNQYFKMK